MNILIHEKPYKLLQSITKQDGKKGINKIGKDSYSTYASRYDTVLQFEKMGYVTLERIGREVIATLTDKGKEVLKCLDFLF